MMSRLLGRGLLAGLAGGLIAFVFAHTVGETSINQAVSFESGHEMGRAGRAHDLSGLGAVHRVSRVARGGDA